MIPLGGPFYTLEQLLGPARRNWVHLVSKSLGRTLCGFGSEDYPKLLQHQALEQEQDCPDCLRVAMQTAEAGLEAILGHL